MGPSSLQLSGLQKSLQHGQEITGTSNLISTFRHHLYSLKVQPKMATETIDQRGVRTVLSKDERIDIMLAYICLRNHPDYRRAYFNSVEAMTRHIVTEKDRLMPRAELKKPDGIDIERMLSYKGEDIYHSYEYNGQELCLRYREYQDTPQSMLLLDLSPLMDRKMRQSKMFRLIMNVLKMIAKMGIDVVDDYHGGCYSEMGMDMASDWDITDLDEYINFNNRTSIDDIIKDHQQRFTHIIEPMLGQLRDKSPDVDHVRRFVKYYPHNNDLKKWVQQVLALHDQQFNLYPYIMIRDMEDEENGFYPSSADEYIGMSFQESLEGHYHDIQIQANIGQYGISPLGQEEFCNPYHYCKTGGLEPIYKPLYDILSFNLSTLSYDRNIKADQGDNDL
jgi:hypothetical protein